MADVPFSLVIRPAVAQANFHGSTARLVSVPKYSLDATVTPDCCSGHATVANIELEDDQTPFEKIDDGTFRLLNRDMEVAPVKGGTRIGAAQLSVKNIGVEVQVAVQRNLNSILTLARKGPNGRPLA